jgi:aromatic ring hydroxylase
LLALTGEMPRWMPRANEILQLVGGAGFMATPSQADLESPIRGDIDRFFQGLGAEAEERIRLFRLAWDFVGSELGARAELHERFHLDGSWRNRVLAYHLADKQFPIDLVASLLDDTETQARAGA